VCLTDRDWLRLLLLLRVLTQEDRESTELGGQNGPTPRESAKCEVLAWGFSNPLTQRGRGRVPLNDLEPNHYKRIRHIIYTIRASTGTPRASKDKTQITSIPTIYVYLSCATCATRGVFLQSNTVPLSPPWARGPVSPRRRVPRRPHMAWPIERNRGRGRGGSAGPREPGYQDGGFFRVNPLIHSVTVNSV